MKEHDFIERLNVSEREQMLPETRAGLIKYLLRVTPERPVDIYVNKERNPNGYFYMGTCPAGEGDEQSATWLGRFE